MKFTQSAYWLVSRLGVLKNKSIRASLFGLYFLLFRFKLKKGFRFRNEVEFNQARKFVGYLFQSDGFVGDPYEPDFFTKSPKIIRLKKNLDAKSATTINRVIKWFIDVFSKNLLMEAEIVRQEDLNDYFEVTKSLSRIKRRFKLSKNYYEEGVFVYKCGLSHLPSHAIKSLSGKDVIDGGAFIGDSALVFNTYKVKNIYAFEPDKNNFKLLRKTIKMNRLKNVLPLNFALGGKISRVKITEEFNRSFVNEKGSKYAKVTTIDEFLRRNPAVTPRLIKLDIEGMELEAVKGAKKTIKKFRPILLISLYHTPQDFFEIKPLIESWIKGYKFRVRKLNPNHPVLETVLIAY